MSEKVEMAEQVPLKSDTEAQGPVAEGADVEASVPEKKKRTFFWQKTKKVEENKDESEPKKEGEKKCWWSRKCNKEQQPSFGFDMVNRDEKSLHTNIDLGFSDIFGEPDATRSFNGVWKFTHRIFLAVRCIVYKLLTLIFAIPLAIVFGILYAIVSALNVFVCVPFGRLVRVPAAWIFNVWNYAVGAIFDPLFRSCGLCLSGVTVRQYGINSEVTQPITA